METMHSVQDALGQLLKQLRGVGWEIDFALGSAEDEFGAGDALYKVEEVLAEMEDALTDAGHDLGLRTWEEDLTDARDRIERAFEDLHDAIEKARELVEVIGDAVADSVDELLNAETEDVV
jgi:hypothetical protein